jgi:hypothetical protein
MGNLHSRHLGFPFALPVEPRSVCDPPASAVQVVSWPFAVLPVVVELHAADALRCAKLIDAVARLERDEGVAHSIRSMFGLNTRE